MVKVAAFPARIRKSGHSYVVTVQRDVIEKFGLKEGDTVVVRIIVLEEEEIAGPKPPEKAGSGA